MPIPSISELSLEQQIVSEWRRQGHCASAEMRTNVHDIAWVRSRVAAHSVVPLSKGDLALVMEYASDRVIRDYAQRVVRELGL